MGFKFSFSDTTFPCEVKNKELIVHVADGLVQRFQVNMPDMPLSTLGFNGEGVAFCMEHESIIWVGRNDGTITGFRDSDICIKHQRRWTPNYLECIAAGRVCGFHCSPIHVLSRHTNIGILPRGQKIALFKDVFDVDEEIEYNENIFGITANKGEHKTFLRTKEGRIGRDYEPDITWVDIPVSERKIFLG